MFFAFNCVFLETYVKNLSFALHSKYAFSGFKVGLWFDVMTHSRLLRYARKDSNCLISSFKIFHKCELFFFFRYVLLLLVQSGVL